MYKQIERKKGVDEKADLACNQSTDKKFSHYTDYVSHSINITVYAYSVIQSIVGLTRNG